MEQRPITPIPGAPEFSGCQQLNDGLVYKRPMSPIEKKAYALCPPGSLTGPKFIYDKEKNIIGFIIISYNAYCE